eukprot:g66880.t1
MTENSIISIRGPIGTMAATSSLFAAAQYREFCEARGDNLYYAELYARKAGGFFILPKNDLERGAYERTKFDHFARYYKMKTEIWAEEDARMAAASAAKAKPAKNHH